MGTVDPEVADFFKGHYSSWKNALSRWHKKCGSKIKENEKQKKKRHLVASRETPLSGFKGPDQTLSDATPYGYPSKSKEDEAQDQQLERQASSCKKTIEYIQKMIELLNNARTTGRFPSLRNYTVKIRKQPKYITGIDREHKVDRGEVVEVKERKGNWLRIKTADAEGWIPAAELMPEKPLEGDFTIAPVGGTGTADDSEVETGVRDTVGSF